MSFDPNQPLEPYRPLTQEGWDLPPGYVSSPKQSGMGIASLVIGILGGVAGFGLFVAAGVLEATTPGGIDETSPIVVALGLGILGIVALSFLGVGLGIGGLIQPNRSRIVAALGLIFNSVIVLGFVGIIALGLAMGG